MNKLMKYKPESKTSVIKQSESASPIPEAKYLSNLSCVESSRGFNSGCESICKPQSF